MPVFFPDELKHNNPNYAIADINNIKGLSIVANLLNRDAIPKDKRKAGPEGSVVFISGTYYQYTSTSIADSDWENEINWVQSTSSGGGGEASIWVISEVSASSAALPFVYYLVSATVVPITMSIPVWTTGNSDEYYFKLDANTHKVTITDGTNFWIIPTLGGSLFIKGGVNGWKVVTDNTHFYRYIVETTDRDFSDGDGFENNDTYAATPAVAGEAVVFTLPAPNTYSENGAIKATFLLASAGSLTVVRMDGGVIGGEVQQTITTIGSTFTILEAEGVYRLVQDSRPKAISNISLPFYRLTEASDEIGFLSLARTKDDPRYGVEQILPSGSITSTTYINYASYITDSAVLPDNIPRSQVSFFVTTRRIASVGSSVKARYRLYRWEEGGAETLIVETSDFVITATAFSQYTITAEVPETTFNPTDRLVLRVDIARTDSGGTNPQLETKVEGDFGAYFISSVPSTELKHNDFDGRLDAHCHVTSSVDMGEEFTMTTSWGFLPAGTVVPSDKDLLTFFKDALSQYTPPSFTAFAIQGDLVGTMEVGETLTVSSATYGTSNDSDGNPPSDVVILGAGFNPATIRTGGAATADQAPFTIVKNTASSESWTISGEDANANPITRNTSKVWNWVNKFGADSLIVTDTGTAQSVWNTLQQEWFGIGKAASVTCTADNDDGSNRTYYMYPASYGSLSQIIQDGASPVLGAFTEVGNFTILNAQSVSFSVKVYRSNAPGAFADGTTLDFS